MLNKTLRTGMAAAVAMTVLASAGASADEADVRIVGSSTVYPFSTAVAERFGKMTSYGTPIVESTGTGGGMKLFCAGTGANDPVMTNASRRIKSSEVELCASNGINDIVEIKVGYDGIVFANSVHTDKVDLTREEIFSALAKELPDGKGGWVANPNKTWHDVADHLPNVKIEVLGPPPTSGTRDAFVELVMDHACEGFEGVKGQDKDVIKAKCRTIREDGSYIMAGENDNLIVQKLNANKNAFGIFGFSFLDQNSDVVQGSVIEGQEPTYDAISDGSYPVSRSLFFYVKKSAAEKDPAIKGFIAAFTNEDAWGPDGYLADKGLIAMSEDERKDWHTKANNLEVLGDLN